MNYDDLDLDLFPEFHRITEPLARSEYVADILVELADKEALSLTAVFNQEPAVRQLALDILLNRRWLDGSETRGGSVYLALENYKVYVRSLNGDPIRYKSGHLYPKSSRQRRSPRQMTRLQAANWVYPLGESATEGPLPMRQAINVLQQCGKDCNPYIYDAKTEKKLYKCEEVLPKPKPRSRSAKT